MDTVTFQVESHTLRGLIGIADEQDCSVADVVRDAVRRDLFRRTRAKKAVRADERLVAPLRALLADDLAYATGWDDLQDRLRRKGYAMRAAGGGLALVAYPSGRKLAKASDLGYGYSRLMRRFDAPFPGHGHTYLFERVREGGAAVSAHCDPARRHL